MTTAAPKIYKYDRKDNIKRSIILIARGDFRGSSRRDVVGMSGNDGKLIDPDNLPYPDNGCDTTSRNMIKGKWYRIAIGAPGSMSSTGIFNIGTMYNNNTCQQVTFIAFCAGFSSVPYVSKLCASSTIPIPKVRFLYKDSTEGVCYMDIFANLSGTNKHTIAASSLIGFKLQQPVEVSDTPDEGYICKEFSL